MPVPNILFLVKQSNQKIFFSKDPIVNVITCLKKQSQLVANKWIKSWNQIKEKGQYVFAAISLLPSCFQMHGL